MGIRNDGASKGAKGGKEGKEGDARLRQFVDLVKARDLAGHVEAEASRDYVVTRIEEWLKTRSWSWKGAEGEDRTAQLGGGAAATGAAGKKGGKKGKDAALVVKAEGGGGSAAPTTGDAVLAATMAADITASARVSLALEQSFVEDHDLDLGMVRLLRHVASSYIREHKEDPTPSGMTYEMTVTLGMDFPSLQQYFDDNLEKMGEDAAAVVHVALPLATGIMVRMEYLDRRTGVEQMNFDFPDDGAARSAYVLIKPGHFDLMYGEEKRSGEGGAERMNPEHCYMEEGESEREES